MVRQLFPTVSLTFLNTGRRYSTGSNLNANSALIQNLYSQETTPLQAVHLAIDTGLEESGEGAGVKAYIRSVYLKRYRTVLFLIKP
jgi:hypothetical protein